jgi:hypothetical protein
LTLPWLRAVSCAAGARGAVRRFAAALIAVLPVAACAAVSSSTVEFVGGDAAISEAGSPLGGFGDGAAIDASACHPGAVPTFTPTAYRPAEQNPGACSSVALQALYTDCFAPAPTPMMCGSQELAQYATCAACLETLPDAGRPGPLIIDVAGWIRPNVAGCIELIDPSNQAALACAEGVQELMGCEFAACAANCPVTSGNASSIAAYDACAQEADMGGCQRYVAAASCAQADGGDLQPDGGATIGPCTLQTSLQDFYFAAVPLFCGPPAVSDDGSTLDGQSTSDGAASAGDGGVPSEDATAPGDGALEDARSAVDAAREAGAD